MIERLRLWNFLSFRELDFELRPLNILIGANGVGKSNLLQALRFLSEIPRDVRGFLRSAGEATDLAWGGEPAAQRPDWVDGSAYNPSFAMECRLRQRGEADGAVDYQVQVGTPHRATTPWVELESPISYESLRASGPAGLERIIRYRYGHQIDPATGERRPVGLNGDRFAIDRAYDGRSSFLSVLGGPEYHRSVDELKAALRGLFIAEPGMSDPKSSGLSGPTRRELNAAELLPNGENLPQVVRRIQSTGLSDELDDLLRRFNPRLKSLEVEDDKGSLTLYAHEHQLRKRVPSWRLSDGTLLFLALAVLLIDPYPPLSAICLEEPESGLHPDAVGLLAEMLQRASERTQVVITTHSDRLIDCFSDRPEAVVVADRDPTSGETTLSRLEPEELTRWLEDYRLGKLWTMGHLGGVTE